MSGTYLQTLGDKQKFELCLVRILKGSSYAELAQYVEDEWGGTVTRQTVGNFFRSAEGAEAMDQAYDHLRKEYSNEPLIEKSTRVMALREQAERIQRLLRDIPPDAEDWVSYSQEFRQYMKQISVEMEGIQMTVKDGKSAAEMALEAVQDKQRRLALVE